MLVLCALLINIIAPVAPIISPVTAVAASADNTVEITTPPDEATSPTDVVRAADAPAVQLTFHTIYLPFIGRDHVPAQAKADLEAYVTPMLAFPGDIVTHTLTVHSAGGVPLAEGDLYGSVPVSLTVLENTLNGGVYDAQNRTIRWASPQLAPDATLTVTFQTKIEAPAMTALQSRADYASSSFGFPDAPAVAEVYTATLLVGESMTATLSATGGELNTPNGQVRLVAPAGAVAQTTSVRVADFPMPPLEPGAPQYLAIFDIQAVEQAGAALRDGQGHTTFLQPLSVTLSLTGSVLGWRHVHLLHFADSAGRTQTPVTSTFDAKTGELFAERKTFSGHAAVAQNPFPTDNSYYLFHSWPSADLYSGAVSYQIPLETPSGNGGIGPGLSLNYSSRSIDGMLGLVQSADVGLGWTLGGAAKIARSVTTHQEDGVPHGETAWEYKDEFTLHINGSAYQLIWREGEEPDATPGCAYYTEEWSALRVMRYNKRCKYESGVPLTDGVYTGNAAGEYWVVTTPDGAVYRIGESTDSEQLVFMRSYNPDNCELHGCQWDYWHRFGGYAGERPGFIAATWSVNSVQDTHGNVMQYSYMETQAYAEGGQYYDKESHLATIIYGGNAVTGAPSRYRVEVNFEERRSATGAWHDDGPPPYLTRSYSLYDTYRVRAIKVCVDNCTGDNILREYVLHYDLQTLPWPGYEWVHHDYPPEYTLLASLATYGRGGVAGGALLPLTTFGYQEDNQMEEKADPRGGWFGERLQYFRLEKVNNGYGAEMAIAYEPQQSHDIRSYRVKKITQQDGVGNTATHEYEYGAPCFVENKGCRRNQPESHILAGHAWTTMKVSDYDETLLSNIQHYFSQDPNGALGREYETRVYGPTGEITQTTVMTWNTQTDYNGLTGQYHTELRAKSDCLNGIACTLTEYTYDAYGNVSREDSYGDIGVNGDELSVHRAFAPNTTRWILNKPATEDVRAGVGAGATPILRSTRYFYDGSQTLGTPPERGDLTRSQAGRDDWGWVTTESAFNTYGNPTRITDTLGYTSTVVYDTAFHQFPVETCNALNQCAHTEYYGVNVTLRPEDQIGMYFGAVYRAWGPNGEATATATRYDAFGRTIAVVNPGDNWAYPSLTFEYHDGAQPGLWAVARQREQHRQEGTLDYYVYHDGLGRLIQTWAEIEGGFSVSGQTYNALGAVVKSYLPITGATAPAYTPPSGAHTATTYDALGRATQVQNPDGSTVRTQYLGWETTIIDANAHYRTSTLDAYGRTAQVDEFLNEYPTVPLTPYATTRYTYDLLGNLLQVEDDLSHVTAMEYDPLGRKTAMHDPDMGDWVYGYDAAGNLTYQIDAKAQVINFYYDPLSRLKGKTYGAGILNPAAYTRPADPGTYAVAYTYDDYAPAPNDGQYGRGQRTGMTYPGGVVTYRYDERGRLTAEAQAIETLDTYTTTYLYDALNRVVEMGHPNGETILQNYNAGGQPNAITSTWGDVPLVKSATYNAMGQMTSMALGNNLTTAYAYYPADEHSYLLRSIQIPGLMDLSYDYDPTGNIDSINDGILSQQQQFTYDALNRLTDAHTTGAATGSYSETYRYDKTGNLMTMGEREYAYGNANHVHAVTAVTHSLDVNRYAYDANGNMIRREETDESGVTSTYTQTFDLENRLASVTMTNALTQTVTRFIYDGDGRRLAQVTGAGTTLYVGDHYEEFWQEIFLDVPDLLAARNLHASAAPTAPSGASQSRKAAVAAGIAPAPESFQAPARIAPPPTAKSPAQPNAGADMIVSLGGDYEFKIIDISDLSVCTHDRVRMVSPSVNMLFNDVWQQWENNDRTRQSYISTGESIRLEFYHYQGNWSETCGLAEQPVNSWNPNTDKVNVIVLGNNHWRVEFEDHDSTGGERDVILEIYPVAQVTPPTWVDTGAACVADSSRAVTWNSYAEWWYRVQRADNMEFTQNVVSVDVQASGATATHTFTDHTTQRYYYRVQTLGRTGADPSGWSETRYHEHDRTPPVSSVTLKGLKNGDWYVALVGVTLLASDNDCAGVAASYYRLNGGAWETYQNSFNVTEVGTHTLEYYTADLVGNVEDSRSLTFQLDPSRRAAKITQYYYLGGQRVAMRSPDGTITYLHPDHLDSASLSTDAAGAVVARQRYYPFGAIRDETGNSPTDFGFTGQRLDASTGLMYYRARYYAPGLGRFVQADTMVPNPGNPQSFNRYAYVMNNPLRYTDPSGYFSEDQIREYLTYQYGTEADNILESWKKISEWWNILSEAVVGDYLEGEILKYSFLSGGEAHYRAGKFLDRGVDSAGVRRFDFHWTEKDTEYSMLAFEQGNTVYDSALSYRSGLREFYCWGPNRGDRMNDMILSRPEQNIGMVNPRPDKFVYIAGAGHYGGNLTFVVADIAKLIEDGETLGGDTFSFSVMVSLALETTKTANVALKRRDIGTFKGYSMYYHPPFSAADE